VLCVFWAPAARPSRLLPLPTLRSFVDPVLAPALSTQVPLTASEHKMDYPGCCPPPLPRRCRFIRGGGSIKLASLSSEGEEGAARRRLSALPLSLRLAGALAAARGAPAAGAGTAAALAAAAAGGVVAVAVPALAGAGLAVAAGGAGGAGGAAAGGRAVAVVVAAVGGLEGLLDELVDAHLGRVDGPLGGAHNLDSRAALAEEGDVHAGVELDDVQVRPLAA
jgi:hypothetical protein